MAETKRSGGAERAERSRPEAARPAAAERNRPSLGTSAEKLGRAVAQGAERAGGWIGRQITSARENIKQGIQDRREAKAFAREQRDVRTASIRDDYSNARHERGFQKYEKQVEKQAYREKRAEQKADRQQARVTAGEAKNSPREGVSRPKEAADQKRAVSAERVNRADAGGDKTAAKVTRGEAKAPPREALKAPESKPRPIERPPEPKPARTSASEAANKPREGLSKAADRSGEQRARMQESIVDRESRNAAEREKRRKPNVKG